MSRTQREVTTMKMLVFAGFLESGVFGLLVGFGTKNPVIGVAAFVFGVMLTTFAVAILEAIHATSK